LNVRHSSLMSLASVNDNLRIVQKVSRFDQVKPISFIIDCRHSFKID